MDMSKTTLSQAGQIQHIRKRILVLGSNLHLPSVTAYAWTDLPGQINVADYDVVILNLVSLLDQQSNLGIRPERLPSWQQLARYLFSPGIEVICIGMPELDGKNNLYQSMTWWLPVVPEVVLESGDVVREVKGEFDFYFEHVKRWFFYVVPKFRSHFLGLTSYLKSIHPQVNHVQAGMGAIATTRSRHPIAFKLIFRAGQVSSQVSSQGSSEERSLTAADQHRSRLRSAKTAPVITSGVVIWLPPPTEITPDEAVNLILQERYGRASGQAPPKWIQAYHLPQQQAIAAQVTQYQEEMRQLSEKLTLAQKKLEVASYYHRLLYERNHEVLEQVACAALRELGAEVDLADQELALPLRIRDPLERKAVLVIRGRTGSVVPKDLRKLDQEVRSLMLSQNWQGKGILIVNPYCDRAPEKRSQAFPPSCIRAAEQFGYCLLTTTQLFDAIATYQRQTLDLDAFWNLLFTTQGICELPSLEAS